MVTGLNAFRDYFADDNGYNDGYSSSDIKEAGRTLGMYYFNKME